MSLYNMLHGMNRSSDILLSFLGLTRDDFGRFRDCYINDDGNICVYTRNGGGNRESYEEVFNCMEAHKYFIRDYDDDFDCTYATYEFRVPDAFRLVVKGMMSDNDSTPPNDRWIALLDKMKGGKIDDLDVQKAMAVGAEIFKKIDAIGRAT